MFLTRAIQTARAASVIPAQYSLVDARTGELLGAGNQTDTGQVVTPEYALGYHPWYRAMTLIATKSAAVPKYVMKHSGTKRGVVEVADHNAQSLIGIRANSEQTAYQFWLQMVGHVCTRGNGYAVLWRNTITKRVEEIIPLDPDKTHAYRKAGRLWYACFPFGEQGQGYTEPQENILHFKGLGFDGLTGYPLWEIAANEINLGRSQRKLESMRYKNSGRPSMILETDKAFNQATKQRIVGDWERMNGGLENAGKTAVLDRGLKAKAISMSASELDSSGAAAVSIQAISNYTGVPVSKLGGGNKGTTNEQDNRSFIDDGLDVYLNILDDECTAKLLSEKEVAGGTFIRSDREALIRPDRKSLYELIRIGTAGRPVLTPNEGREMLDYPASPEEDADKLLTPLNMGKGGINNQPTDNSGNDPGRPASDNTDGANAVNASQVREAREAARYAVSHACTRMVKRLGQDAAKAAKSAGTFTAFLVTIAGNRNVFLSEFSGAERFASAVNLDGSPARGAMADTLLAQLSKEYTDLSETGGISTLAARVETLRADQLLRLPQVMVKLFVLPDPDED